MIRSPADAGTQTKLITKSQLGSRFRGNERSLCRRFYAAAALPDGCTAAV